jgi:hypothetical protein
MAVAADLRMEPNGGRDYRITIRCCTRVPFDRLLKHDMSMLFEMQENMKQMEQNDFEERPSLCFF